MAQNKDSLKISADSLEKKPDNDSLKILADSLKKTTDKDALKSKVKYNAKDSIAVDIKNEKIYLYGNAEINYEKINIKASYIVVDFSTNEMYA